MVVSGGNEQDDGLQNQTKTSTLYLSHSKWLFVIALAGKAVFVRTGNRYDLKQKVDIETCLCACTCMCGFVGKGLGTRDVS